MNQIKSKRAVILGRATALLTIGLCSVFAVTAMAGDRHRGSRAMAHLSEIDANADGMLTQAEIDTFRATRAAEMDTNGDGAVSFEEANARHAAKREQRARARFDRQDQNGDGVLSADEIGNRAAKMFERLDTNSDGIVDAEELASRRGHHRRGHRHQNQGE